MKKARDEPGFLLERFQAKACPGLDPGWRPVRVKKTRQIKNPEPCFDSIEQGSVEFLVSDVTVSAEACRLPRHP
jgi:hypothetical protein